MPPIECLEAFLLYSGACLWNEIPPKIRTVPTLLVFWKLFAETFGEDCWCLFLSFPCSHLGFFCLLLYLCSFLLCCSFCIVLLFVFKCLSICKSPSIPGSQAAYRFNLILMLKYLLLLLSLSSTKHSKLIGCWLWNFWPCQSKHESTTSSVSGEGFKTPRYWFAHGRMCVLARLIRGEPVVSHHWSVCLQRA